MNESQNSPLKHHMIKESEQYSVHLHEYPSTPGVTIITSKLDSHASDLFQLPPAEYEGLMMETRGVAHLLQHSLHVQRCAMVTEPSNLPAHVKLIPLYGLDKKWESVTYTEEEFNEEYPGYVSSKNGPRLSKEALDEMTQIITSVSQLTGSSNNVFHGESTDNNLFARIVRGEEVHWRVWEDDDHVAFLTPFPNTPGFTVLVPRKHLPSDIFALEEQDYKKLVTAARKVVNVLKKSLQVEHCAMIFEGYEIDYAHVKLIPIYCSDIIKKRLVTSSKAEFSETYQGFVSSADGPKADDSELQRVLSLITNT